MTLPNPAVGGDKDAWGTKLNAKLTDHETRLGDVETLDPGSPLEEAVAANQLQGLTDPGARRDAVDTRAVEVGTPLFTDRDTAPGSTPESLIRLSKALGLRDYNECVVLALGDSLIEGTAAATYANSLVPQLLTQLLDRFPCDHYGYYIPAAWASEGGATSPQDKIPATTGTVTKATGATAKLGMARKSIQMSTGATLTFAAERMDHADIEFCKVITTGTTIGVDIDGVAQTAIQTFTTRSTITVAANIGDTTITVSAIQPDWRKGTGLMIETGGNLEQVWIESIAGLVVTLKSALTKAHATTVPVAAHGNGAYFAPFSNLGAGTHVIKLTAVGGPITVLGMRTYVGDRGKGIHLIQAGHGGITAAQLKLAHSANTYNDMSMQSIGALNPCAVISELFFNDSGVSTGVSPSTFATNLGLLRADVNGVMSNWGRLTPSWIQAIPYEINPGSGFFGGALWSAFEAAVYGWARADTSGPGGGPGIFVINVGHLMPRSDTTPNVFYNADLLHPNDAGAARFASIAAFGLPVPARR